MSKGITAQAENFSEWYNDIVYKADLAEHSAVRGCMVIKPYGFAIWEYMQSALDKMFKKTGHQNAYFPIFIPKSFLSKEAQHVEGFATECAVVTHYRLKNNGQGEMIVDPEAKLEEELIVRPTSETIIWNSYKNWIQSYRDLPILINQWANVVRWEMRTRLFLRTAEFLWQEGHTAHATDKEAIEEAERMLQVYTDFVENHLAIAVVQGRKTENERFAGAIDTLCIEALMQDGRALQAGTSHFLGQNFAKAFDVKFLDKEGKLDYVWATSWGVSTRLMGALIMSHSDDNGLILPPKVAPHQVVIVPIWRDEEQWAKIKEKIQPLLDKFDEKDIRYTIDNDETKRPGFKFAQNELKGVPVRLVVGLKDIENNSIEIFRRDTKEKKTIPFDQTFGEVETLLVEIQNGLLAKSKATLEKNIRKVDTLDEFKKVLDSEGGFVYAHWDGTSETEQKIKEETKATIRCVPLDNPAEEGKCIYSQKPSTQRVLFAKNY